MLLYMCTCLAQVYICVPRWWGQISSPTGPDSLFAWMLLMEDYDPIPLLRFCHQTQPLSLQLPACPASVLTAIFPPQHFSYWHWTSTQSWLCTASKLHQASLTVEDLVGTTAMSQQCCSFKSNDVQEKGMVVQSWNHSSPEAKAERQLQVPGQPGVHSQSRSA